MIELAADRLGFGLGDHVEIAVVVVADVFLVEAGDAAHRPFFRVGFPHVPVGDELQAVGIDRDGEEDDVVQNAERLGVVAADHLPDQLDQVLRADDFGGVQAAVDPDDGLAFGGEACGRRRRSGPWPGQAAAICL